MLNLIIVALFQPVAGEPAPESAPGAEPAPVAAEGEAAPARQTQPRRQRRVCNHEDAEVGSRMSRRRCRTVAATPPEEETPADEPAG